MQTHWYATYTRPSCERKVAQLLAKKGHETYYPRVYRVSKSLWWSKIQYEPLMKSIVFVKTTEEEIKTLGEDTNCIRSLLYFAENPAVIADEEIDAMKDFVNNYTEIEIERIRVEPAAGDSFSQAVMLKKEGRMVSVRTTQIRLKLPTLGIALVSKLRDAETLGHGLSLHKNSVLAK